MAGIGERLKGVLRGENHAAEGLANELAEIEAMSQGNFRKFIEAQMLNLMKFLFLVSRKENPFGMNMKCWSIR